MSLVLRRSGVIDTPFLLMNLGKHTEALLLMRMDFVYFFGPMRQGIKMKRLVIIKNKIVDGSISIVNGVLILY